jgi:hypothetical protein
MREGFVLPFVVGYAIASFWAPGLVLVLLACAVLASALEPLQRPKPSEIEPTPGLVALVMCLLHIPLLIAGAGVRRFVRSRSGPPGRRSAR